MDRLFNSNYRYIFIIGLIVFLVTAYFSTGYLHPDEHFQILEFCNYKLGNSSAHDLPWEFHEKIRPTLQPTIALVLIKTMNLVGIYNPVNYSLVFRILSSLLSWLVISNILLLFIKDFPTEKSKKIFLSITFFLWFMPLISVRFSSENFSALTFLSSLYFIIRFNNEKIRKRSIHLVLAGLFLGFSFFFRFQIGFAIAGLGLWLVLINKMHWKKILILTLAGVSAAAFCVYLDFRFYGEFEMTPVNYFIANIIENKAARWGTSPWWYYIYIFTLKAVPPISLLLLIPFALGVYVKPRSILTWCIMPFLIAHFLLGHKELRFMFPMVFCFIYLSAIGIDYFINNLNMNRLWRFLAIFSIVLNISLLSFRMFTPAQEAINYYKFLYKLSAEKEIVLLSKEESVYELAGLKVNFYKSENVRCIVFKDDAEILNYLEKFEPDSVFLLERKLLMNTSYAGYSNNTLYCPFPQWLIHLNFNNWISRSHIWKIQELRKI